MFIERYGDIYFDWVFLGSSSVDGTIKKGNMVFDGKCHIWGPLDVDHVDNVAIKNVKITLNW